MKVLYNYEAFLPFRGGVSRIFIELAKFGFFQSGVHLNVFSGFNRSLYLKEEKALRKKCCGFFIPPPFNKVRLILPLNRIFFALYSRFVSPDVCHYTNLDIPYVPRRTKTVITIHDLIDEIFNPLGLECPRAKERRRALDRADGVICVSENTKYDLLRIYPDVLSKKIAVIYNGNSIQKIAPASLEKTHPYLLYVGDRGAAYKNFTVLLQFLEKSSSFASYRLVCFGGGSFSAGEMAVFRKHGLGDRITLDSGSDAKLVWYYQNAFALVYPSQYEGFGIPTIEAMSLECPVVCSNAPPMPEVNGDGALYFSPDSADALADCLEKLKDPRVRMQCVELGKTRAAQFSWEKTCRETYDFYRQVLECRYSAGCSSE
jgi:glycosyltransferase involved in cell wall biosynthesis